MLFRGDESGIWFMLCLCRVRFLDSLAVDARNKKLKENATKRFK